MLKLSRKTLLALEAVIDIAFNARPEPVQAKEITARQGVPQRYLEQVMQQLVRAGILNLLRAARDAVCWRNMSTTSSTRRDQRSPPGSLAIC